jgi:hypothetical protein
MDLDYLKYPTGKIDFPKQITTEHIKEWIIVIKEFPSKVRYETGHLSKTELAFKYRPNGWNIAQLIAHCADSHLNSFVRFKLALTEKNPTIKPYDEEKWAELCDALDYKLSDQLQFLESIHKRWVFLLEHLSEAQFNRTFIHPDGNETISLKKNLCIYNWHCKHHLQHIINAKKETY